MSDSEDDYMSDKLLQGCDKEDIRPGLLHNNPLKRSHEMYKKQLENRTKNLKSYHQREVEAREAGLNTAISSDNKGFKLLEKMGYKSGEGLGKSVAGIKEPISISTKNNSSGVGREKHIQEVFAKRIRLTENERETREKHFKDLEVEKAALRLLKRDFHKARRACEDLDFRNDVKLPKHTFFWTKETMQKLKSAKKKDDESEESTSSEEEEEEVVGEASLLALLVYLRETYFYCLYCGAVSTDQQDLESFCPGILRADHGDIDIG